MIGYLYTVAAAAGPAPAPRGDHLGTDPAGPTHLYQGFGGFVGNVVMGLLFGWVYTRTRRAQNPSRRGPHPAQRGRLRGLRPLLKDHLAWLSGPTAQAAQLPKTGVSAHQTGGFSSRSVEQPPFWRGGLVS